MKKNILLTTVGISFLSLGLATTNLSQDVHAAKVTAGKTAKVAHTAYVYNSKGKRVKKTTLKKNKTTKVIKIVKIKGKNYAQIGKNQFVKLNNLITLSSKKENVKSLNDAEWTKLWKKHIGFKITAKKDTVIRAQWIDDEHDHYDDTPDPEKDWEIPFPKGSSIYTLQSDNVSNKEINKYLNEKIIPGEQFSKDGIGLMGNGEIDAYIPNSKDVQLEKWLPSGKTLKKMIAADKGKGNDVYFGADELTPQIGNYKHHTSYSKKSWKLVKEIKW